MFPWYDSNWHAIYEAVRLHLIQRDPERASHFVRTLAPLKTRNTFEPCLISSLLSPARVEEANAVIADIAIGEWEVHELKKFGRLVCHDHPWFTELQAGLTEMVSELAGEEVVPCYNFLAAYNQRGVCEPHMDEPIAKWTLDIPLKVSAPWPLHISPVVNWPTAADYDENWQASIKSAQSFTAYEMLPGSGLLFSGSSQWHYRDPAPVVHDFAQHLIFMHYQPAAMAHLVNPHHWAEHFGVEEISRFTRRYAGDSAQ